MKNTYLLLVFFSAIFPYATFGQYGIGETQIDSLELVLSQTTDAKEKQDILRNLYRATIDNNTQRAQGYAQQMVDVGIDYKNNGIAAEGYNRLAITYSYSSDYTNSLLNYKEALKYIQTLEDNAILVGVQYQNIGMDYSEMDQLDSCFYYYDKALAIFESERDSVRSAIIYRAKSNEFIKKGYYNIALENVLEAATIFEAQQDTLELSVAQINIAKLYLKLQDTLSARNYLNTALDYFKGVKRDRWAVTAQYELAKINFEDARTRKSAWAILDSAIAANQQIDHPINLHYGYLTKGVFLKRSDNLPSSREYIQNSIAVAQNNDLPNSLATSYMELGDVLIQDQQWANAKATLEEGMVLAKSLGLQEELAKGHLLLSRWYEQNNDKDEALARFKLHKIYRDSIYNVESGQKLAELQTIYETEKKEAALALQEEEIKTLNQEVEISNLKKGMYAGGMASALALFGLSVFGYRQRIKRNRIAREKQEAIYKQEIEHKKKELASQTLHLVQKNTFLEELKENLENLKNSPEKFKMEFRRIVMLLKKEKASDKDWETFKTYFSEVHNDFDQKLKTLYADISEKEIRLAAFLRMNLTTKEIAATMNVLPDSILKSKYRLKKKLGLDREMDLTNFLNTL